MNAPQPPQLEVVVDDEHPWFDQVYGFARTSRSIPPQQPDTSKPPQPPAPPQLEVVLGGVVQKYTLGHIAELKWEQARGYMRIRWSPVGAPQPCNTSEPTATQTEGTQDK
jgi:hypothetical protein